MVSRDEGAHLTASHLDAVFRSVQVGLHAVDVTVQFIDVIRVGFRGELRVHRTLETVQLLVHRNGRGLGLLTRGQQLRMREVQLVGDHFQVALQLLVDFVFLGEPLRQRVGGLLDRCVDGLLNAIRVTERAQAHSEAEQRHAPQYRYG